jgi:hypothetical protein
MLNTIRQKIAANLRSYINGLDSNTLYIEEFISTYLNSIRSDTPEVPILYGFKVYSQVDEDGIIEHILEKIAPKGVSNTFIEVGCGNGLENNTHYLALKKFKGVWIDGSSKNISHIKNFIPVLKYDSPALSLLVQNKFVTQNNVGDIIDDCCKFLKTNDVDFFSFDTDGNDLLVVCEALCHFRPKVICVEYNAKFPPTMDIAIARDDNHSWSWNDYFGASLLGFANKLDGYRLVSCNVSGTNAFFVRDDLAGLFPFYPIDKLYQPARYQLVHRKSGHPPSLRFLKNAIEETTASRTNSEPVGTVARPRQVGASARAP